MIDTHCHIDQYDDPRALLQQLTEDSQEVVCMSLSPAHFETNQAAFAGSPFVHVATGLIPQEIDRFGKQADRLIEQIGETRFIGEVGLDYLTTDETNRALQRRLFDRILNAAANHGARILSIHSRRAAPDAFNAIGNDFPGIAIMHWYSGSIDLVESAPKCIWFSINTAMVSSRGGKAVIRAIPPDRLLIESDGPYVRFSNRPARPRDATFTAKRIAAIRGWTEADTIHQISNNWDRALATYRT